MATGLHVNTVRTSGGLRAAGKVEPPPENSGRVAAGRSGCTAPRPKRIGTRSWRQTLSDLSDSTDPAPGCPGSAALAESDQPPRRSRLPPGRGR